MQNTINIPTFLYDFHGEKSNWMDIIAIHLIATLTTAAAIFLTTNLDWPIWKYILIGILAYDLGGGVIANFTYSANQYYDQSNKKRLTFLSLHFLQPAMLSILFFEHIWMFLAFCGYILMVSFIINTIKGPQRQLTLSACLVMIGVLILLAFGGQLHIALRLLLIVFMLKLPLAFSVRWYRFKGS